MTDLPSPKSKMVLPVGTQIVTRAEIRDAGGDVIWPKGAVAELVSVPDDHTRQYRARFPDGAEVSLDRQQFAVRKQVQREGLRQRDDELGDLAEYVIYRCVVGSRAYGLDEAGPDVDRRGFYPPPAELHWSLFGVPDQLENTDTEEVYWEVERSSSWHSKQTQMSWSASIPRSSSWPSGRCWRRNARLGSRRCCTCIGYC